MHIHLIIVLTDPKFYRTSYIVYLLVAQHPNYSRLTRKGIMQDPKAWPYIVYPHLVRRALRMGSPKLRIVKDAFNFVNIRFLEGDYAKRLSIEVITQIKDLGGIFL